MLLKLCWPLNKVGEEISDRQQEKQIEECECVYCIGNISTCGLIDCCCGTESPEYMGNVETQKYKSVMCIWKGKHRRWVESNRYQPKFQIIMPQQPQPQSMNMVL